jgi:hypothetical protein
MVQKLSGPEVVACIRAMQHLAGLGTGIQTLLRSSKSVNLMAECTASMAVLAIKFSVFDCTQSGSDRDSRHCPGAVHNRVRNTTVIARFVTSGPTFKPSEPFQECEPHPLIAFPAGLMQSTPMQLAAQSWITVSCLICVQCCGSSAAAAGCLLKVSSAIPVLALSAWLLKAVCWHLLYYNCTGC